MRKTKGKKIVRWLALGTVLAMGIALFAARDVLRELWWMRQLESSDPEVRQAMAQKLGTEGGERAVPAIAEGMARGTIGAQESSDAIEQILGRLSAEARTRCVRRLLALLRSPPPTQDPAPKGAAVQFGSSFGLLEETVEAQERPLVALLKGLAALYPDLTPLFAAEFAPDKADDVSLEVILAAWPQSQPTVEGLLKEAEPRHIEAILEGLRGKDPSNFKAFADWARQHARPEVRAAALVKAFAVAHNRDNTDDLAELLARAYHEDGDALVPYTALKLTAFGCLKRDALDLSQLLEAETDPDRLVQIIEAITYRPSGRGSLARLELSPGFVVSTGGRAGAAKEAVDRLAAVDLGRLEEILVSATDARLRDAAAACLVTLQFERAGQVQDGRAVPARVAPGLGVHEWGVWADLGGHLEPVEKALAELPSFVHRSAVARLDLSKPRPSHQSIEVSFKPILFFHAREPVSLLLRVHQLGGMPWASYPDASNYVVARSSRSSTVDNNPYLRPERAPQAYALPKDLASLTADAPWLRSTKKAGTDPQQEPISPAAEGELANKFHYVPWDRSWESGFSLNGVQAIGLEWRGLRVGFGEELEAELRPLSASEERSSWWQRLREVPAATVAFRGEAESFLFYDGSIDLPAPVQVRWADASRKALSIRTLDFLSLPKPEHWPGKDPRTVVARGEPFPPPTAHFPAVFVVSKSEGRLARGRAIRHLGSNALPTAVPLDDLDLEGDALVDELRDVLIAEGLTAEEAASMVDVWRDELFVASGLRVLTVLPRWLYDAVLPLEMLPAPEELVRVGVVWKECASLEVETAVTLERPAIFEEEEGLAAKTRQLRSIDLPLTPGPPIPFQLDPEGELLGIGVGVEPMVLSGDGRHLSHVRLGFTALEVYLGDLDQQEFRLQASFPPHFVLEDYACSWDGTRAAFLFLDRGRVRFYVLDTPSALLREYVDSFGDCDWTHFSQDGVLLSFHEGRQPRVLNLETGELLCLSLPARTEARKPMLTPNGKLLAVNLETMETVKSPGEEAREVLRKQVALIDLERRTLRRLAHISHTEHFPLATNDGKRVLFVTSQNNTYWACLADLEGSRLVRLGPCSAALHLRSFTDDGERVLYSGDDTIWSYSLRTGESRIVYKPRERRLREGWIASDGSRAYFRGTLPKDNRASAGFVVPLAK